MKKTKGAKHPKKVVTTNTCIIISIGSLFGAGSKIFLKSQEKGKRSKCQPCCYD